MSALYKPLDCIGQYASAAMSTGYVFRLYATGSLQESTARLLRPLFPLSCFHLSIWCQDGGRTLIIIIESSKHKS